MRQQKHTVDFCVSLHKPGCMFNLKKILFVVVFLSIKSLSIKIFRILEVNTPALHCHQRGFHNFLLLQLASYMRIINSLTT